MSAFRDLDPLLHSQLRLSIVSLLISMKSAEFSYLVDKKGATRGNVSVQPARLFES